MDEKQRSFYDPDAQKKILFYARLSCLLCAAMFGLILCAVLKVGPQIMQVVQLAETELQKVDTMVEQINQMTNPQVLQRLADAAGTLSKTDFSRLNDLIGKFENFDPEKMDQAFTALNQLNLSEISESISKLNNIIEPLSRFASIFN